MHQDRFDVIALRDDDHNSFDLYQDAVRYVDQLVEEWVNRTGGIPEHGWASADNMYAVKCGHGCIQIVRTDDN
jgi:hypothetical protein